MCNQQEKLPIFAYTLKSLLDLQLQLDSEDGDSEEEDSEGNRKAAYERVLRSFSNTRTMKLLYFTCLESVTVNESGGKVEDIGLFKCFDNFRAYERGPVEVDIYKQLSEIPGFVYQLGRFVSVNIEKLEAIARQIPDKLAEAIKKAIKNLKDRLSKEVFCDTQKLVDKSHMLPLWNYARFVEGNKMHTEDLKALALEKSVY